MMMAGQEKVFIRKLLIVDNGFIVLTWVLCLISDFSLSFDLVKPTLRLHQRLKQRITFAFPHRMVLFISSSIGQVKVHTLVGTGRNDFLHLLVAGGRLQDRPGLGSLGRVQAGL